MDESGRGLFVVSGLRYYLLMTESGSQGISRPLSYFQHRLLFKCYFFHKQTVQTNYFFILYKNKCWVPYSVNHILIFRTKGSIILR
jgi:hypothetical protein